ncbi:MAG: FAD-dependent oxidoreductase [Chloroflexi bacterium]|nr:FAD-dependent oxidoreductase [Chloroflexota bacterium]
MKRVVVIGGGISGCSAAITAARAGVEVVLLERMDFISGLAPWSGELFSSIARLEAKLLGGGDLLRVMESLVLHHQKEFNIPYGCLTFDVTKVAEGIRRRVHEAGVQVALKSRVVDVERRGDRIQTVILANEQRIEGDTFVDATGNLGGVAVCQGQGQGCVLCYYGCNVFGDRVGISEKAGIPDVLDPAWPVYFPATLIAMQSLPPHLRHRIEEAASGYYYHPLPPDFIGRDLSSVWRRPDRPVATGITEDSFPVVNVGHAKVYLNLPMTWLRLIPGFENTWLLNPVSAEGQAASLGGTAPHDATLKVDGLANLFCAGLRAGRYDGVTEMVFTGDLAGHNAARTALGIEPLPLPPSTMLGYFIARVNKGHTYAQHPLDATPSREYQEAGLTTTKPEEIKVRLEQAGLLGIYQRAPS